MASGNGLFLILAKVPALEDLHARCSGLSFSYYFAKEDPPKSWFAAKGILLQNSLLNC